MKLQVNVSDELVKQIDEYSAMMGISRSALCATFIGQGVLGYNKSFKLIDDIGQRLGDSLLADKIKEEVLKNEKEQ